MEGLRNSKPVLRKMIKLVEADTRTITGKNLRNILLTTTKPTISEISAADMTRVDPVYYEPEGWWTDTMEEILRMRTGDVFPPPG